MPRFRNEATGAVVSVSESTATRLGSGWVSADERKSEPNEAPKRRGGQARKSDSEE